MLASFWNVNLQIHNIDIIAKNILLIRNVEEQDIDKFGVGIAELKEYDVRYTFIAT